LFGRSSIYTFVGALEALLSFLRDMKIPVATVNIGPVHKRDVMKCSTQLQHDAKYAMILAFDVKVSMAKIGSSHSIGVTLNVFF
jgi:translation initiation factor 5B